MAFDLNLVSESFEMITNKFKVELQEQLASGRIKSTEYADVYKSLMDRAMQLAWQTPTLDMDISLKQKQEELADKDLLLKDEDIILKQRQEELITCQVTECTAKAEQIVSTTQIAEEQNTKDLLLKDEDIVLKQKQEELVACQTVECTAKTKQISSSTKIAEDQSDKDLLLKDEDIAIKQKQEEKLTHDITNGDEKHVKEMELADEDKLVKKAQTALYTRQESGFDDNNRQKMLDIQMNTWAMMFSSGLLTEKPSIIENDEVSDLYCYMKDKFLNKPCDPTQP